MFHEVLSSLMFCGSIPPSLLPLRYPQAWFWITGVPSILRGAEVSDCASPHPKIIEHLEVKSA